MAQIRSAGVQAAQGNTHQIGDFRHFEPSGLENLRWGGLAPPPNGWRVSRDGAGKRAEAGSNLPKSPGTAKHAPSSPSNGLCSCKGVEGSPGDQILLIPTV